jgi:hypothetical protein
VIYSHRLIKKEVTMADEKVSVIIKTGDHEDLFFKEQEQKQIKMLRDKISHESDKKYKEEHKNHCFRCGTQSLAEINYGSVKVDVCINDKCGAMHLDPGELEEIMKDQGGLDKIRKAVFSIFK